MTYTEKAMRLLTGMGDKHYIYTQALEEFENDANKTSKAKMELAEQEWHHVMEEFRILTAFVLKNKVNPNTEFSAGSIRQLNLV